LSLIQRGRKVEKEEKLMTGGAWPKGEQYGQRKVPLPLMPKGERSFVDRGACSEEELWCCHQ